MPKEEPRRTPGPAFKPDRRRAKTNRPLRIFSGSANPDLARAVASCMDTPLGRCTTTRLPDSEIHVQIDEAVRGDDIFLIQPCPAPVNDHLIELLLYVDAFRRASAHSITAVMPYFPYARQERMAQGREAISAKVVATSLEALGASRVLYVDIHAPAIQGFFNIPADPLSALKVLCKSFLERPELLRDAVVVAPDSGRVKLANKYAERLGVPLGLMHKRRTGFDQVETTNVVGDLEGKVPILIDDIIAGGSVLDQIPSLIEAGAVPHVHLAITHGILTDTAITRLDRPEIAELCITDSVPLAPERRHPKIRVCSIASMLAQAIERIHEGSSLDGMGQTS